MIYRIYNSLDIILISFLILEFLIYIICDLIILLFWNEFSEEKRNIELLQIF